MTSGLMYMLRGIVGHFSSTGYVDDSNTSLLSLSRTGGHHCHHSASCVFSPESANFAGRGVACMLPAGAFCVFLVGLGFRIAPDFSSSRQIAERIVHKTLLSFVFRRRFCVVPSAAAGLWQHSVSECDVCLLCSSCALMAVLCPGPASLRVVSVSSWRPISH